MDIGAWLSTLGLQQYAQAFRENNVDNRVLPSLTAEDLIAIGVTSVGHRRMLLDAVAALTAGTNPPKDAAPMFIANSARQTTRLVEAERRQLTVMLVDLVGSTALASKMDPEELREVICAYQNVVAQEVVRFEGHVAKFMGDGVVVYFGWPRAHEDDAERAVRAGLAIVEAVPKVATPAKAPLEVRVGIATGLVVVGDLVGEGAAQEEAVVGETPNLASRLQTLAEAGGVVIADGTRRLLGDLFELVDMGTNAMKGFAAPMRAWRAVGESWAESRFEALHGLPVTPLVGRDQELALLLDRWHRAKGAAGQVVMLSGESGIGKSRIVLALHERLHGERHVSVRYQASPYNANSPLFPIINQLERAAGLRQDDAAEVKLGKLETLLGIAAPNVKDATPLIADLLAIPTGDRYPALDLAPQPKKAKTFQVLLARLDGLAAQQPVLMVVEDAHWLDPTSLELFDAIVDRMEGLPILLLMTFRPEFTPRWAGRPHLTFVTLNRLGQRDGAALIANLIGGKTLPRAALTQILAKTDGVPLFVEELTKAVLESGLLREVGRGYELTGPLPSVAIPSTLQDSLMARLDRLASVKEVAQTGAVIGRDFTFEMLAAVADMDGAKLLSALDELVRAGLLFRRSMLPEGTYSFKHALVQDAAYESLLRTKRQRLHWRIAAVLEVQFPMAVETEPESLARHYAEAGQPEQACRYLLRAAQLASRRSANPETIAHCNTALALIGRVPEGPERWRLELELRVVLGPAVVLTRGFASHEVDEVYTYARELCQQLGDTPELFPVLFGLWGNRAQSGQFQSALSLAADVLDLARRSGDASFLLQGYHASWTTLWYLGDIASCLDHAKEGIELYDFDRHRHHAFIYGGHDPGVCCRGIAAECFWLLGYPDQALANAKEAVDLGRRLSHPISELMALISLAPIHRYRHEAEPTRRVAEAAIRLCADHGIALRYSSMAAIFRGWALVLAGNADQGIEQARHGIKEHRSTRPPSLLQDMLTVWADTCLHSGRSEEGLAAVAEALANTEEGGRNVWLPELHCIKGDLLLSGSVPDEGEAQFCFERALSMAQRQSGKSLELRAATKLARLWAERGERQRAHDLLVPIHGWFTEGFDTPDLVNARLLLDALN